MEVPGNAFLSKRRVTNTRIARRHCSVVRMTDTARRVSAWGCATRAHRVAPLGWTAPQAAGLTGVPTRTLQVWRNDGFYVPALPAAWTGHLPGELYMLGDLAALVVLRALLGEKLDRSLASRAAAEIARPIDVPGEWLDCRAAATLAEPWWLTVPVGTTDGRPVTEDDIDAMVREAEAGYDVDELLSRRRS